MRFHILAIVLMAGAAIPAAAQRAETPERRIERLEQEMRAVQRRVFPGAQTPIVGAEIDERAQPDTPSGVPASSAAADLTARLDAIESQLRDVTGQVEQNGNRLRQLESGFATLRDSSDARLDALEKANTPAPAVAAAEPAVREPAVTTSRPAVTTPKPSPSSARPAAVAVTDEAAAEEAYNQGFHLWEQKRYAEARQALEAVAKRYPNSKWVSWANNLAGRAYLDDGKPVPAARTLLANYQNNPKGERAADSLFYVGKALVAVGQPQNACKAYDELQDVYGNTMREGLRKLLPAARAEAKCR